MAFDKQLALGWKAEAAGAHKAVRSNWRIRHRHPLLVGESLTRMRITEYWREMGHQSHRAYLKAIWGQRKWRIAAGYEALYRWRASKTLVTLFESGILTPVHLYWIGQVATLGTIGRWVAIASCLSVGRFRQAAKQYLRYRRVHGGPAFFIPLWLPADYYMRVWHPAKRASNFETLKGLLEKR